MHEWMTFRKDAQWQRLAVGDLRNGGAELFSRMPDGPVEIIYSDPPWNPGNEKYWRTHAGRAVEADYGIFLDTWLHAVSRFKALRHLFCEQSENERHRQMFFDAVSRSRLGLPLLEQWTVYYGSPGSRSCQRPNRLLHFGADAITTDPGGLSGEAMTRRVFEGLSGLEGKVVADPCIGKGMTSRMADYFGMNCIGMELNPRRLDYAIRWLLKRGYRQC